MSEVDAVLKVLIVAIIALLAITVVDALPAVEGPLAPAYQDVRRGFANALTLAVGGVLTITIIIFARLRSM